MKKFIVSVLTATMLATTPIAPKAHAADFSPIICAAPLLAAMGISAVSDKIYASKSFVKIGGFLAALTIGAGAPTAACMAAFSSAKAEMARNVSEAEMKASIQLMEYVLKQSPDIKPEQIVEFANEMERDMNIAKLAKIAGIENAAQKAELERLVDTVVDAQIKASVEKSKGKNVIVRGPGFGQTGKSVPFEATPQGKDQRENGKPGFGDLY